jgi:hypothetical protein
MLSADRARACRASLGSAYNDLSFAACVGGPVGAVRASVGISTVPRDIDRLVDALAVEFAS